MPRNAYVRIGLLALNGVGPAIFASAFRHGYPHDGIALEGYYVVVAFARIVSFVTVDLSVVLDTLLARPVEATPPKFATRIVISTLPSAALLGWGVGETLVAGLHLQDGVPLVYVFDEAAGLAITSGAIWLAAANARLWGSVVGRVEAAIIGAAIVPLCFLI